MLTGVIFLVLSLAGCGAGAFGCASFVNDLQKSVDQGGETPLGTETTFTATGSMGAILTTDPTSTTCEGTDGSGSTMSFSSPGSGTTGNVQTDGRDFDLAFTFDTDPDQSYSVTCRGVGDGGSYLVIPFPGFSTVIGGLAGIGAGMLFFVIGIICTIVGLVKRSGWKKRNGPGGAAVASAGAVPRRRAGSTRVPHRRRAATPHLRLRPLRAATPRRPVPRAHRLLLRLLRLRERQHPRLREPRRRRLRPESVPAALVGAIPVVTRCGRRVDTRP